jgi:hypothetical protein
MVQRMKMFRCVFIFRVITAANVTACQAKAQMDPLVTGSQTLFTAIGVLGVTSFTANK